MPASLYSREGLLSPVDAAVDFATVVDEDGAGARGAADIGGILEADADGYVVGGARRGRVGPGHILADGSAHGAAP